MLTPGGYISPAFISNEWFFKRKPADVEPQEESLFIWITKNIQNRKLRDSAEVSGKEVVFKGLSASLFFRNKKPITDVRKEFEKDLKEYQSIFSSVKSKLEEFGRAQQKLTDALHSIASPSTSFDKLRTTILKSETDAQKFSGDSTIAKSFKEPSYAFLGDYLTPFLTKNDMFDTDQHSNPGGEITLEAVDEVEIKKLVALAADIDMFCYVLESFDDEKVGMCWDLSDSPTRGFTDELDNERRLMTILNVFMEHGMVTEEHNAGVISILRSRADELNVALWTFIRRSLK